MGQIGILARVSRRVFATASRPWCDTVRHCRVWQIGGRDVRGRSGGGLESPVGTSGVTREFGSIAGVTETPVLADGSFWRYRDNLVVGGFSAVSRKCWLPAVIAGAPTGESIRHGDRHCRRRVVKSSIVSIVKVQYGSCPASLSTGRNEKRRKAARWAVLRR